MRAFGSRPGSGPATEELPLTPGDQGAVPARRRWRRAPWAGRRARWVIAAVVVLVAGGVAVAITGPFTSGGAAVADNADATGTYTVARQDLSSQTQVPATLGYAGSYTIAAPSGASAQQVSQAQQAVTQDQQTLSADEQYESDQSAADDRAIAADQANVTAGQSALSSDQATESRDCAGSGASNTACSEAEQKVSQDQGALATAQQQLANAQSTATLDHDQNQAKVQSEETTLRADQATLASLQATEVNPGTAFTWLPQAGDVIKEDQPVYSLSNEPVPLLYGTVPAYRAFYAGMSDGADVGELTKDLIALGYGAGLTQGNDFSAATAAAVERWQSALGLPATGEILLGQVVFEPGPIQVSSVTPAVGQSEGGGGNGGGGSSASGGGGSGGGTVLTATSTDRQVSVPLDTSQESEVAVGDQVTITLPDNQTTPGVISSVGTVATTPSSSGSGSPGSSSSGSGSPGSSSSGSGSSGSSSPTITVLVNPTNPAATGSWDQAPVTVNITTSAVTDALVVPVDALRALSNGGYAVEVVGAGGLRHLVTVNLGLFDDADGMVQVTGTRLAVGQQVVVPDL